MTTEGPVVHAVLTCRACGTDWPVNGRLAYRPAPMPLIPWLTVPMPHLALDKDLVNSWTQAHYGPIALTRWHLAQDACQPGK